jgi:catechol 2,3-dioxygenase-like lactoylglutathione lyase family enzyme
MGNAKVSGLNHLTLAVSDLSRSVAFYRDILGMRVRAQWAEGAYLEAGSLWLCLSLDRPSFPEKRADYTHIAFDVDDADFDAVSERIRAGAMIWKENRSEGKSLYFLDPDGHKLELHVGSLASRLAHYRAHPAKGVTILDP